MNKLRDLRLSFVILVLFVSTGALTQEIPQFDSNIYSIIFNQNLLAGDSLLNISCSSDGIVNYRFFTNIDFLSINSTTGGISLVQDALGIPVGMSQASIECFDVSNPQNSNFANLFVEREDSNEFNPRFLHQPLVLSFSEDTPVSSVLTTVNATDEDRGEFGIIEYSIVSNNRLVNDLFHIDVNTGQITLQASLDHEVATIFVFLVGAANVHDPVVGRNLPVTITVEDIDDTAPSFEFATYDISVHETVFGSVIAGRDFPRPSPGFLITRCTDPDTPAEQVTYSVMSVGSIEPLVINETSGSFSVTGDLDFETRTSFTFSVSCNDNSMRNLSSTVSVNVGVLPVNEEVPVLVQSLSIVFSPETTTVGEVVATANQDSSVINKYRFTDIDDGPDGNITYTLRDGSATSQDSQFFSLDLLTGDLTITEVLDNDVPGVMLIVGLYRRFALSIVGCDEFPPSDDCDNFLFTIFVTSVNEFAPVIAQNGSTVEFPESYQPGGVILSANDVSCTDGDRGSGGLGSDHVEFINPSSTITSVFNIDSTTGEVRLRNSFDYEMDQSYGFEIRCYDNNGLDDRVSITVTILPENDNRPIFDQRNYIFNVSRTTPSRYQIGSVSATDADIGFGGDIVYNVESNGFVDINSDGGLVLFSSVSNVTQTTISFSAFVTDSLFMDDVLIVILVTEGNTNHPRFAEGTSGNIDVSELVIPGETIFDLSCTDSDSGANGQLRYYFTGENTGDVLNAFRVDEVTGEITVRSILILPDNTPSVGYSLHVRCEDMGVPVLDDDATVFVTVFEDDSNPPVIANNTINLFISEDTQTGTVVATIEAVDVDSEQLNYRLENQTFPGIFFINRGSGVLTLESSLDRETVAQYKMTVVVTEVRIVIGPERSDTALVNIFIRDVNDNAPSCVPLSFINVDETASIGESIVQLQCNDPDIDENGLLSYTLDQTFGVLDIDTITGEIIIGNLFNNTELTALDPVVIVTDGGIPTNELRVQVFIEITSSNRNQPTFTNLPTTVNISEAQITQEVFFTVLATDPDRGTHGLISYGISGDAQDPFRIFSGSGGLFLRSKLDFFDQQVHVITITAQDSNFTVSELLTINVLDANEFSPICDTSLQRLTIPESIAPSGIQFQQLSCSDEDQGSNGQLSYSVVSGNVGAVFEILEDGTVSITQALDYETVQEYDIEVQVSDGGTPPRFITIPLGITVSPVNEFTPAFDQTSYELSIVENSDISLTVFQFTATDQDESSHPDGQIVFSISGQDDDLFTISRSGLLRVAGFIDRETHDSLTLMVHATDEGIPAKSTSAVINITVTDLDDNPPVFTRDLYQFEVNTSAVAGTSIGVVACTDRDALDNSVVRYSFDETESATTIFGVGDSGVIELLQDISVNTIYTFTVFCTGPTPLNRSDSTTVSVRVLLNSTISFIPGSAYEVRVNENTSPLDILVINASSTTGATLTYTQLNLGNQFEVDQASGTVRLIGPLDFEATESYNLRVEATDNGNPPNTNEALVQVFVVNLNDEQPRIVTQPETISLDEQNIAINSSQTLRSYQCLDGDKGTLGRTSFRIANGNTDNIFSITESGSLLLVRDLDFESMSSFTLDIVCEDGGSPPLSASVTIPINVQPINDNPPVFSSVEQISVEESLPTGMNIGTPLVATDQDSSPHDSIVYSIISGDTVPSTFAINPSSGQLTLQTSLDFETRTDYSLEIRADDSGGLSDSNRFEVLSDTINVGISVINVNDNRPIFSASFYSGTISESAAMGDMVFLGNPPSCTDADELGDLIYSISENVPFEVQSNGAILLSGSLDFETAPSYRLDLLCSDSSSTSRAFVLVIVTDVDEHGPEFVTHAFNFSVTEDASVGTLVGTILAIDLDGLQAGFVMYEISNTAVVPFDLDSTSGDILLSSTVDFEDNPLYTFTVEAFDAAGNRDTALVVVEVNNINDNPPMFATSRYFLSVRETSPIGTLVGTILCTDLDNEAEGIPVKYSQAFSTQNPFRIDPLSGDILVSGVVDLEMTPMFSFRAFCNDSDDSIASTDITIVLEPFNDFAPIFIRPSQPQIEISEDVSIGDTIVRVIAFDQDQVSYSVVVYSITAGNENNTFSIDPTNGFLRVERLIDREVQSEYLLTLQAENEIPPDDQSNSTSMPSTLPFRIIVLDINDNPPIICPANPQPVELIESNSTLIDIAFFECTDIDDGDNGMTSFSISSLNLVDSFEVTDSGVVRTTTRISTSVILDITCSDNGTPPRSTTVSLAINSVVANEHAPMFSSPSYSFSVPEDSSLGSTVTCFNATDMDGPDSSDGIIKYSLMLQSPQNGAFSIRIDTGCLFVSVPLSFDMTRTYIYQVIATDSGSEPLSSTAQLLITIEDTIPVPPVFQNTPYSQTLFENQESGTRVVQLVCTDIDDNDRIEYSITAGNNDAIFTVNSTTGVLSLSPGMTIDFEMSATHLLTVACTDIHNLQAVTTVTVIVSPVNEFTPTFISGPFNIDENSILGSQVTQLVFFDGDNGVDGNVIFEVIGDVLNDTFSVTQSGSILINSVLDREVIDFYSFEVRITDQSADPLDRRSSSNLVNITILDQNDNEPVFEFGSYTFGPLDGNETLGYIVGNVVCTDEDLGANSVISYFITDRDRISFLFEIDPDSGHISVSGDLDTRQVDDIIFFVECTDSGPGLLSDSARILVEVVEVNRNAPEFLNESYSVRVPEDTDILVEIIITVTAKDIDDGVNGVIRYSLEDSFNTTFFIDEDTGELSLLRSLDFENRANYVLTVIARDGAVDSNTQMTSQVDVFVQVTGVNEFEPSCVDPVYVSTINRTTLGQVIDFQCIDDDLGLDGILSYEILSGDNNMFFIVSDDGFLTVPNFILPNTAVEQFVLQIRVTDRGSPSFQTDIRAVLIYSFDNLNSPDFDFPLYEFNVTESSTVGEIFGSVQATDSDPGLQGIVTYSVSGTNNFQIDIIDGDLFVSRGLDWEERQSHTFTVTARDSDPISPRQGFSNVTVTVINENDNIPQCEDIFYAVEIFSNASIGETVLQLDCIDPDQTPLQYELASGMVRQSTSFAIEATTGRLYVVGPLTPSVNTVLTLRVIGNNRDSIQVTVSIQVIFVNVEPPLFDQIEFSIVVPEDAPLLSTIGSISATDIDSEQRELMYSFGDPIPPTVFYVNPSSGEIVLTAPLNFETTQEYSFVISVVDSGSFDGSNQLSDTATLVVNVTNTNDHLPVLSDDGIYGSTVDQTTIVGTSVLSITCNDIDAPPHGSPQVTIAAPLSTIPFSLTMIIEGMYTLNVSEPLSGPSSFIFNVTCTDDGGERDEGQVYIFVPEPLAPMFTQPRYNWFLRETAESGTDYSDVQASSNDGSTVRYLISDGNDDGIFYIDPSSGAVTLVTSVDYETQTSHGLIVQAVDGKGRQSSVLLIVQVLDENDEVPLTPPSALLSVSQNSPVGFPIGVLDCTDQDSSINASSFSFSFVPDNDLFSVDDIGVVRLEGVLSDTPVYSLPVVCFDLDRPDDVSRGVVTIEVEFVNLNQPEFGLNMYTFSIREDAEPLTFVGQVSASDRDVGSFGQISYAITEGNPDSFFIDASTGRIGVLTSLDRESTDVYFLTVAAVDGGVSALENSRLNETTLVVIRIEDANDNPPLPDQFTYIQSITTNHTLLSPVLTVTCSDPDLLSNGIINYSIEPDSVEDFVIRADGTVLLAREQTNQAVHNIFVVCTDQGIQRLSSSAMVTITVDTVSLTAPVFDQIEYNITIEENIPIGSTVLQVNAVPSDPSVDLVYSIVGGNEESVFSINPLLGILLVTNQLDASLQQVYILTVSATITDRTALSSLANVQVIVTDLNDNNPQFSSPFYTANVTERASVLTPILQATCSDIDLNADISYSILYSLDLFNITDEGLIIVAGDVDFERNTTHTFEVVCSDGGEAPRSARASVRIDVDPVNEFVPMFTQSQFNFTASENSFGALIGQLQAVDGDAGSDGIVRYFLQDPANNSVVFINSLTGELIVANNLDYEVQTSWVLSVIARDDGGSESHALLHIEVQNLNDVLPVISPITSIFTITSDRPMGFPIQAFTCVDADGSDTTLSTNSGNSLGLFELDSNRVLVWTGQGDILEANAVISLNLVCEDKDSPDQRATGHIAIRIQVNDAQPPLFSEMVYSRNVSENAEIGTVVLSVSASSESMNVSYSFFNLPASFPFSIDPVSGEISLTTTLNRESESLYTFFVGATDIETSGVGVVLIEIRVEDANDNDPTIVPSDQAVTLPEDFELSTEFIRFMCSDRDSGSNGEVSFAIISGNENDTFVISPLSAQIGSVSLSGRLDFEYEAEFSLVIECRDGGSPALSDTANLTVVVTGVNEFPPVFSQQEYFFQINETDEAGKVVGTVFADDMDDGDDGVIEYQINPTLDYEHFSINSIGEIRTTSLPLNASMAQQLLISLRVVDRGGLDNDALVTVTVEDINTRPILSDFGNYFVTLTSNQTLETILELFCYDIDVDNNSALSLQYTNVPTEIIVQTNSQPGLITASFILNSVLDAGTYNIPLTCSDGGTPPLSVSSTVTIQVQGVNSAPTFVHGPIFLSVLESTLPGTFLTSVNATDSETSVTYAITGGIGRGVFTIDSETGEVSLLVSLDYELNSEYNLIVTAFDQSLLNPLSAQIPVAISVGNVNDEFPNIQPRGVRQIVVNEDQPLNSVIQTYTCEDPDRVDDVTFSVLSTTSNLPFRLTQNGEVVLQSSLDYERQVLYELEITCTDSEVRLGEGVTLMSSVILIVVVVPVNSHPPVFHPPFEFTVPESAMLNEAVAYVNATDMDNRGQITYSSESHSDLFVVQSMSGDILLAGTLDYESNLREYTLIVVASDGDDIQGITPRTASMSITIYVADTNDNPPVCQPFITSQLTTGTYSYIQIAQLSCTDQDSGNNSLLIYSLQDSTLSEGEAEVNGETGEVGFRGTITRSGAVVLKIGVRDSSDNPRETNVTIVLSVDSSDNNTIRFTPNEFNISIFEDVPIGMIIFPGTNLQTALINPAGSEVQFRLRPSTDNGGSFVIDPSNGDITVVDKTILDYESSMRDFILVVDAVVDSITENSAIVHLSLLDSNDNHPRFDQPVFTAEILENQPAGVTVLQVTASDIDSGMNGVVRYSIEDSVDFQIDPVSGHITSLLSFDRETNERYSLVVIARDLGTPSLNSSTLVTITILDENDEAPMFLSSFYVLDIDNLTPPNEVLLTLEAIDNDVDDSLVYTLLTNDTEITSLFVVDFASGVIRRGIADIPVDHDFRYNFTVQVSDQVNQRDTSTIVVYIASVTTDSIIFVENIEDQVYDAREFLILQDFQISNATYEIIEGNTMNQFIIDSEGLLTTRATLDREMISEYVLTIHVEDDVSLENVNVYVTVTVQDQNDNAPTFVFQEFTFSVPEGTHHDRFSIGIVSANDIDESGSNAATIEYSIVGALFGRADEFAIDPKTGDLFVKQSSTLDRERFENHTIVVRARDFGEPGSLSNSVTVVIYLTDINDNDPEFIPIDVVEYFILLGKEDVAINAVLDNIIAILPKDIQLSQSEFEFTDPDSTSTVTASLIDTTNDYKLIQNFTANTAYLVSATKISADASRVDILQIVLADELNETNPIIRNITVQFADVLPSTPPTGPLTPSPPFFQTDVGIAVIIVISMLIFAMLFFFLCMCCYCYMRIKREKDPLRNRDRLTTVAQRLQETEKSRKKTTYGRPLNYLGYSDLDPLEFPEFSPPDQDTQMLYSPDAGREFESSFMDMDDDYDPELGIGEMIDPFDPSTDTSMLSSLPIDDSNSDSTRGYTMGPVLRAMLEEWDKGDELLTKNKKKKKKHKKEKSEDLYY